VNRLPIWVYGAALAIGGLGFYFFRKKSGTSGTASSATPPFTQTQEVQDFQIFSALTGAQQASDLNFLGEIAGLLGGGGTNSSGSTTGSGGSGGGGSTGTGSAIPSPPSTGSAPPSVVPGGATPPNPGGVVIPSGPAPGSMTATNNANAQSAYTGSVGQTAANLYQAYIATLPAGGNGGQPLNAQQQSALNAYNAAVAAN
jgi:hypothetical protein